MKLLRAVFCGLPGANELEFNCDDVNVFVGPNGSGKSTLLNVLKRALDLLSRRTVAGRLDSVEDWLQFDSVELTFRASEGAFAHFVPNILHRCTDELIVELKCADGNFLLEALRSGAEVVIVHALAAEEIDERYAVFKATEKQISELSELINSQPHSGSVQVWRSELSALKTRMKAEFDHYEQGMRCTIIKAGSTTEEMERQLIDEVLANTPFPNAHFVDSNHAIDQAIPELIKSMCGLKAGKRAENRLYQTAHEGLQHLLQHDIDFFERGGRQHLTVDGADYRKASSGTRVSLAYFGLMNSLNETDIVIWDEPENGLHPTRRIRVLDLIMKDPRQFFVATHALEFAPVFASNGAIFRCDSRYEEDADYPTLNVSRIRGRTDNFLLLEAMGVQPARTLFTANVVIWVEGPTELVFYRHWLKEALRDDDLEEGFHYTIMHYGGGLLSYLDVADEMHRNQAFDALSICRNLAILVDSDLRAEPSVGDLTDPLKPRARFVKGQVERLNSERPGSAIFCITKGREIENYLPARALLHAASQCWKGYKEYEEDFDLKDLECGRYESFEAALERFFIKNGACDLIADNANSLPIVKGKTQWGSTNKVEMMRQALSLTDLKPSELKWDFAEELQQLAAFIRRANKS